MSSTMPGLHGRTIDAVLHQPSAALQSRRTSKVT